MPARPPAAASFLVGRARQNEVRLAGTAARGGVAAQQRPGIERPGAGELAMIGGLLLGNLNGTVNALEPCRCTVPMRESSFMGRYSGDPYPEPGNRRLASARGFAHAVIGSCANGGARPA